MIKLSESQHFVEIFQIILFIFRGTNQYP